MTTGETPRRKPATAQHPVGAQRLDCVLGTTGPVAAAWRHQRADRQLIATYQPCHRLGQRAGGCVWLGLHAVGAAAGLAPSAPSARPIPRGARRARLAAGRNCPARMASRSARNSRLNVASGKGGATGVTTRPARRPGRGALGGADAGKSPSGARIRRTRMAGGRRRARSVAAACRHDSRAMRLTVFLRTASRKSRFGTLMTKRGSSLLPCTGSGRGCARLPWRAVVRPPWPGVNRSVTSK